MDYLDLETEIEIEFSAEQVNMVQVGYLNVYMNRVINSVAATLLEREGINLNELDLYSPFAEPVLVQGVLISVENGSVIQRIRLKVASIFSKENLQEFGRELVIGVAAHLVSAGGVAIIHPEHHEPPPPPPPVVQVDVNKLVDSIGAHGGGRMTYRAFDQGHVNTEIQVDITDKSKGRK